jgi:hypothetical protein
MQRKAWLPPREIEDAAEWVVRTMVPCSATAQAKADDLVGGKGGRIRETLDCALDCTHSTDFLAATGIYGARAPSGRAS